MKPDFLIELLEKCKPLSVDAKINNFLDSGIEYLKTSEFKTKQDKINACLVYSTLNTFLEIEKNKRKDSDKDISADIVVLFTGLSKAPVASTQEFMFI